MPVEENVVENVVEEDIIHLVNNAMDWHLRETAKGTLTDGQVSEDLQRNRVRQIVQWLRHYPERLEQMEALTVDGQVALERARAKDRAKDRTDDRRRW
jgi:hypothetical protein